MHVWVWSDFKILDQALVKVVATLGFTAHTDYTTEVEVALMHFAKGMPPFLAPGAVPTLVLIDASDEQVIVLLQRGYRGYLKPSDSLLRLKRALAALTRGEIWANRALLTRALVGLTALPLTRREHQVLELLAEGCSNDAIAVQLGISINTVRSHISSVFSKQGVRHRHQLKTTVQ